MNPEFCINQSESSHWKDILVCYSLYVTHLNFLERNKEIEEKSKLQISFLQNQSTELEIARQDLEVELKILVGNRTNVAAEIEARASAKASQVRSLDLFFVL